MKITLKNGFAFFCLLLAAHAALAQDQIIPRPSPLAITSTRYKDNYLKITYSQPHKRGREIFGGLVPFGRVWRTGANEATEITTTKDILLNGNLLKAGTYTLFTIPNEHEWTIIINREPGLWGSYNYNETLDVMRFHVPVQQVPNNVVYEPFTIEIIDQNEMADLLLLWDKTRIVIPIKFLN